MESLLGWAQNKEAENAQRHTVEDAQLQNALSSAQTPEEKNTILQNARTSNPSKFKQFIENGVRRLNGKESLPAPAPFTGPAPTVTTQQGAITNPETGEQISAGSPQTVQGPAPKLKSRDEATAQWAAKGVTPEQQDQDRANRQAGWQANFNRQQAGPDLEAKVKAVNSSLDAAGITDPATRQRALQASLGVKQPTVYEKKMEDYNTAVQNGYKGSPEQFLAEEGAKGRAAGGPIKPQATKIMMVGGKPMIMQFNPETRQFDKAIGEAPPTYASIAVQLAQTRAYYGAKYGVTQVTDANGQAVEIPRLEAIKAFEQGNPYMSAAYGTPTGTEKTRQDFSASAQFIIPRMKEIIASHPEVFGPAMGRTTTLQAWVGSQSPDAQRFLTGATILGEHSAAVFGSRAQKVAEQIQRVATDPKINPEALVAGLDELNGIAGEFTNPNGRLPGTDHSGPAPKKQAGAGKTIVQHSASTNQYRYSTDGGRTWQAGQPPK